MRRFCTIREACSKPSKSSLKWFRKWFRKWFPFKYINMGTTCKNPPYKSPRVGGLRHRHYAPPTAGLAVRQLSMLALRIVWNAVVLVPAPYGSRSTETTRRMDSRETSILGV